MRIAHKRQHSELSKPPSTLLEVIFVSIAILLLAFLTVLLVIAFLRSFSTRPETLPAFVSVAALFPIPREHAPVP